MSKHIFLSTSLHCPFPFSDFTVCQDFLFQKVFMIHGREFSSLFHADAIVSMISKKKKKKIEMRVQ